MTWSSPKKKRGHFLYRLFFPKEIFLTFVFHFSVFCIELHFQNIHTFTYQKTLLHTMFCLFLKSSKTFSVSSSKRVINKLLHTQVCIRRKNLVFALVLLIHFFEQKQPSWVALRKRCSKNMQQICGKTPMLKCDFNKATLLLYWNCTSLWMLSCKFAGYFYNAFFKNISGGLLLFEA